MSGQDSFEHVSVSHGFPMWKPTLIRDETENFEASKAFSFSDNIAVTTSGEVLLVHTKACESTSFERHRMFRLYKRNPKILDLNTYDIELVEVESLGDEAMFLDLGIIVPADHTLGIEPNPIYFTHDDRFCHKHRPSCLDMCVYNLATKTTKRFLSLSKLNVKDARWFLHS